jgi:hypothetical protein
MKRLIAIAAVALVIAGCVALAVWYRDWQSWAAYETGSQNTSGTPPNYNYWSGFGSVFPWGMGILATLILLAYHNLRKHNCHARGCWRVGNFPVDGTPFVTCSKHHPRIDKMPTAEEIAEVHARVIPPEVRVVNG